MLQTLEEREAMCTSQSKNWKKSIVRLSGRHLGKVWGRGLVSVLTLVGVVVGSSVTASPALALPASENLKKLPDPTVLLMEDFENGVGADPVSLINYEGVNGQKYRADQTWLHNCNGAILTHNTPHGALNGPVLNECRNSRSELEAFDHIRQLASALGKWRGMDEAAASNNHAVTAYTTATGVVEGAQMMNAVTVKTEQPIVVPGGPGRYVAFTIDTAAINCDVSAPVYGFFLVQSNGDPIPAGVTNPCHAPTTYTAPARPGGGGSDKQIRVGTYTSRAVLLTGSTVGLVMRNRNGSANGNDAAFDNIQILDATPQLDKKFSPAQVATRGVSTLMYTLTNTADLVGKTGWGFTDTLPEGLTVASREVGGTCEATKTVEGGSRITVRGGNLATGQESCTITVQVTSNNSGSYTSGPANVATTGLNPPGDTTVTFGVPSISIMAVGTGDIVDVNSSHLVDAGDTIPYSFTVVNDGAVTLDDVRGMLDDVRGIAVPTLGGVTCEKTSLEPGASTKCDAAYTITDADIPDADIADKSVNHSVTAQGIPSGWTEPITSIPMPIGVSLPEGRY